MNLEQEIFNQVLLLGESHLRWLVLCWAYETDHKDRIWLILSWIAERNHIIGNGGNTDACFFFFFKDFIFF